jgi:transposase
MPPPPENSKTAALRRHSSLNPHPERVQDELFLSHAFFDPHDIVQVKYEMLRRVRQDGLSVTRSAAQFGVSRPTWYQAQRAYDAGGLPALVPAKPGPRRASKLTEEVVAALRAARARQPDIAAADLVALVREQFGLSVHRRSVERALARKKKP